MPAENFSNWDPETIQENLPKLRQSPWSPKGKPPTGRPLRSWGLFLGPWIWAGTQLALASRRRLKWHVVISEAGLQEPLHVSPHAFCSYTNLLEDEGHGERSLSHPSLPNSGTRDNIKNSWESQLQKQLERPSGRQTRWSTCRTNNFCFKFLSAGMVYHAEKLI